MEDVCRLHGDLHLGVEHPWVYIDREFWNHWCEGMSSCSTHQAREAIEAKHMLKCLRQTAMMSVNSKITKQVVVYSRNDML